MDSEAFGDHKDSEPAEDRMDFGAVQAIRIAAEEFHSHLIVMADRKFIAVGAEQ